MVFSGLEPWAACTVSTAFASSATIAYPRGKPAGEPSGRSPMEVCWSVGIPDWASVFSLMGASPITVPTAAFRQTAEHRNFRLVQEKLSGPPPSTAECFGSIRRDTGMTPRNGRLAAHNLAFFSGIAKERYGC